MAGKITATMFQSGPFDSLLTVDPYKVKDNTNRTSVTDVLNGYGTDAAAQIKRNPEILGNIAKTIEASKTGKLSTLDLMNRAGSVLGGNRGILKDLNNDMQSLIAKGMSSVGLDEGSYGEIAASVKDGMKIAARGDISSITGITKLAASLTGSTAIAKIFDMSAEAAIVSAFLNGAIRSGLVGMASDVLSSASSPHVVTKALTDNITLAVQSSDLVAIRLIRDHIGVPAVLVKMPDVVAKILTFYRFSGVVTKAQYADKYVELKALLDSFVPNWDLYNRNGVMVTNLRPFTYAGPDAVTLLNTQPDYATKVLLAKAYPSQLLLSLGKRDYPRVAIK